MVTSRSTRLGRFWCWLWYDHAYSWDEDVQSWVCTCGRQKIGLS